MIATVSSLVKPNRKERLRIAEDVTFHNFATTDALLNKKKNKKLNQSLEDAKGKTRRKCAAQ